MTVDRYADGRDSDWGAADWLVALTDAPEDTDLQESFADWLEADPRNPLEWKAAVHTYRSIGVLDPKDLSVAPVALRARRTRLVAVCAGVAIAACLVLMVLPSLLQGVVADYASGTAEIRRIELADGSIVSLAPESAIAVDFGPDGRRVDLIDGIALFQVSPDPNRPFSVTAANARTVAVGTSFEVRRNAAGDDIAVREGVVNVDGAAMDASMTIKASQAIRLAADGSVLLQTVVPDQVGLWVNGLVTARDRPVGDLVDEIRRYYTGLIFVRGNMLPSQPVTGIYDASDPAAALQLVAASQGAKLYRISPWILVLAGE